jgi:hypothetical protein
LVRHRSGRIFEKRLTEMRRLEFESRLRKKTGTAPAFLHADIGWTIPGWQGLLKTLAARSRTQGVPFGVICDGDADAGGNEAWVRCLPTARTNISRSSSAPGRLGLWRQKP